MHCFDFECILKNSTLTAMIIFPECHLVLIGGSLPALCVFVLARPWFFCIIDARHLWVCARAHTYVRVPASPWLYLFRLWVNSSLRFWNRSERLMDPWAQRTKKNRTRRGAQPVSAVARNLDVAINFWSCFEPVEKWLSPGTNHQVDEKHQRWCSCVYLSADEPLLSGWLQLRFTSLMRFPSNLENIPSLEKSLGTLEQIIIRFDSPDGRRSPSLSCTVVHGSKHSSKSRNPATDAFPSVLTVFELLESLGAKIDLFECRSKVVH